MPRTTKGPPRKRPEAEPEPEAEGAEAEAGRPPRVTPRVERQEGRRYELPQDGDVFALSQRDYSRLVGFLDTLADRDSYALALWRVDPRLPTNSKKWQYLPGGMPLPDGMLEDALAEEHGPGVYRWCLTKDGHFAAVKDLPPSLQGVSITGFVRIAGTPREADGEREAAVVMPPPADSGLELAREMMLQQREDSRAGRSELAEILRANTDSFKAQMTAMVETMKANAAFLQGQLEMQRAEARERTAEKDGMWKEIIGLVKDLRGEGDTRTTADRLLETAPALIDKLQGAGLFAAKPGASPAPAPGQAAPAPPPPDRPMAPPTAEERNNPVFMYVAALVNKLHSCYQAKVEPDLAAESLVRLGTEEQFDWLMDQGEKTVLETVDSLHKRFVGASAPAELLDYTRQVWAELVKGSEPAPAPPPVRVVTGQVVTGPAQSPTGGEEAKPAASGADSGASGPQVQP